MRIRTAPWLSLWESCHRRRLRGPCSHVQHLPSPPSLRSATSPKGRGKRRRKNGILAQICQSARERSKKTASVFLVGSRRSGGKSKSLRAPNRKPAQRLRFGKEEVSTEDKRRRSRRLVPSWSFLTRHFFFWRSKRKSGSAVANLQKGLSLLQASLLRTKIHRSACSPRINSGVVPQQPPRRLAPSSLSARMCRTNSSGPML